MWSNLITVVTKILIYNAVYLAFGDQLLFVAIRRVSRDLTGPEGQSHHQISTTHHQQRKKVEQDGYTHIVPTTRHMHVTYKYDKIIVLAKAETVACRKIRALGHNHIFLTI